MFTSFSPSLSIVLLQTASQRVYLCSLFALFLPLIVSRLLSSSFLCSACIFLVSFWFHSFLVTAAPWWLPDVWQFQNNGRWGSTKSYAHQGIIIVLINLNGGREALQSRYNLKKQNVIFFHCISNTKKGKEEKDHPRGDISATKNEKRWLQLLLPLLKLFRMSFGKLKSIYQTLLQTARLQMLLWVHRRKSKRKIKQLWAQFAVWLKRCLAWWLLH